MRTERTFWTQSLGEHFIVTEYTSPPVKDQTHSNQNNFTFRSSKLVKWMTEYFFLFETCFRKWMSEFKYFSGFLWSNKSTLGSCTQMSLVQEVRYKLSFKYKYIWPHAGWGHQALEPNPDWLTVNLQGEEQALNFRLNDIVSQLLVIFRYGGYLLQKFSPTSTTGAFGPFCSWSTKDHIRAIYNKFPCS